MSLYFGASCLFLIWITYHGNKSIGQRHAVFTYHYMQENETLFNAFLANIAIKSIVSMGAI